MAGTPPHAFVGVTLALCLLGCGRRLEDPLAKSHASGNVPATDSDFDRFMRRDLAAYFQSSTGEPCEIAYTLLREGPTQVGVADPKFYVWVRATTATGVTKQGAVRLAAVDRDRFEVTHFLSEAELRADPARARGIFPLPVCARIDEKLAGR